LKFDASLTRNIGGGIGYESAVGHDAAEASSLDSTTGRHVSISTGPDGDLLITGFGAIASATPTLLLAS
jgi:hypothetical protein